MLLLHLGILLLLYWWILLLLLLLLLLHWRIPLLLRWVLTSLYGHRVSLCANKDGYMWYMGRRAYTWRRDVSINKHLLLAMTPAYHFLSPSLS